MATLIRAVFAIFWLVATGFLGFLVYIVLQTEANPKALWAWLVLCGFSFVSATFLAYNIIFGHQDRANAPHHHTHLTKA
ncbi:MAG TPA: hypothetical protein DEQ38_10745 [Elusimicrobia bacterium]|nr:MAG: hypothetical protein A2089_01590 [Elusimicrobia bacterium GWD2_63_28]HCC48574.1 hypothetical protein [Elusimicrobiota bacterium]